MDNGTHNGIVSFIWGIADDVLRDVYVRGKYRDVILPMTVIRRLDCLLESTKAEVLAENDFYEKMNITDKSGLTEFTKYPFYNTSPYTLKKLLDEPNLIKENLIDYLNGFSDNVQEIISKFKFRNQLETLVEHNRLYSLIQKFTDSEINLSPEPMKDKKGKVIQPGLSNLGMGYVFEELIRRFNEENNEEAGEHFTPRDIIKLMVNLIFMPVKDKIKNGTYLVYDCACGSGGMLTEAENFLQELATGMGKKVTIYLYGQEVNPETYAICQADMLIKEKDTDNIKYASTLANDGFPDLTFDFMLANPPYGKSWKVDQDEILVGRKKEIKDNRFLVKHQGEELQLIPRSSDGQLLFLVNKLSKMKDSTKLGSRIAIVHNGSALFTGDAGSGESNIRRWIIENDWLECIVGLPLNMFYNTGIATYVWILSNQKSVHRRGKVQLIDATEWYGKLRKNLGSKNCELRGEDIDRITQEFLDFSESDNSRIFDNQDFGFHKIVVERPLRFSFQVTAARVQEFGEKMGDDLLGVVEILRELFGEEVQWDFNLVKRDFEKVLKEQEWKLKKRDLDLIYQIFTEKDERGEAVVLKRTKKGVVYQPDVELRDTENVPLKEDIEEYFQREVLPHVPDAWIDFYKVVRGYEISFTKYFYKFQKLRSLEDIVEELLELEKEAEGMLHQLSVISYQLSASPTEVEDLED
ncbi:type I restriction-modification system subunit M [Dapis sp. BLCC M126]|uniref:type I restriction-modification system subunit M n=1 Tax=Dapis sp. BLCC M126 TaxID=3400189 RepID=UPI003CF17FB1